jgi:hypothetical protein
LKKDCCTETPHDVWLSVWLGQMGKESNPENPENQAKHDTVGMPNFVAEVPESEGIVIRKPSTFPTASVDFAVSPVFQRQSVPHFLTRKSSLCGLCSLDHAFLKR